MRTRAQIVGTVGPSSGTVELVKKLIDAGMDLARINFSHGTHEADSNGGFIKAIRDASALAGRQVPIIQDLSGPRGKTEGGHAFDAEKEEITEKDLNDLTFGISVGVEFIAQSYVGSAADVRAMRAQIEKRGGTQKLIAKIERQEAIDDFENILKEADAIMMARGDLGLAVPIEELPFIEKHLIEGCKKAGKPIIIATEMLYSMVENPRPTRAEVTDVAYAILCHADAIMLSDETARGKYPVEAVTVMEKIAHRAEQEVDGRDLHPLEPHMELPPAVASAPAAA